MLILDIDTYADGADNVVNTDSSNYMRPEQDTGNVLQNSELSERIFSLFEYEDKRAHDNILYTHIREVSNQRGGPGLGGNINGYYKFNTSEVLEEEGKGYFSILQ